MDISIVSIIGIAVSTFLAGYVFGLRRTEKDFSGLFDRLIAVFEKHVDKEKVSEDWWKKT